MMALDMALLRKLAAAKARTGKPSPGKAGEAPAEPDADDKGEPVKPGSAPAVNPFAAAAAKAKERLLAAK
jgi:hypothetical protein